MSGDSIHGLPITQINGCRRFGPKPEIKGFNPPRGSEIFVARIPQTFDHYELVNIFVKAGQVFDVRLMLDFMKHCKGFAFVRYLSPEIASCAINFINTSRIFHDGKSLRLVAMLSTDHRTLILTGCAADISTQDVEEFFQDLDDAELESVSVEYKAGLASPIFNLVFATHRAAALMKKSNWRELIPHRWGPWVRLEWQPNDEVDQRRRFKQEKHYFNLMENAMANMCLSGLQLSPPTFGAVSALGRLRGGPSVNFAQPLTDHSLNRAATSGLNVHAPTFRHSEQQSGGMLLSPQQFLSPRSSSNVAQFEGFPGPSKLPLQNQFSGNCQNQNLLQASKELVPASPMLWDGGNSSQEGGAWGGAPLPAPAKQGFAGNKMLNQWDFMVQEPTNPLGAFPMPMLQNDDPISDENAQPLEQAAPYSLFGEPRPILGRKEDAPQPLKHLRF